MILSIASSLYDPFGHVQLDVADDPTPPLVRRINRVATLDGGAAFNDRGASDADRSMRVTVRSIDAEQSARLARLLRIAPNVTVSSLDGCYLAYLSRIEFRGGGATIDLLIARRISD